jgi:hypothetical protein
LVVCAGGAGAAEKVDLLLVLAADVSRSIDGEEFRLQRDGYASALTTPRVVNAMTSGEHGRIAVCFVEWSGALDQKVVVDWTLIAGAADARLLAGRIRDAPRASRGRTAIGDAIVFSVRQLASAPFEAARRVIDVSGDGTSNVGRDVVKARAYALAQGITINGLVILSETPLPANPRHTHPPGGLLAYYENNVVGGVGAFVLAAEGFETFGASLKNKLIREISFGVPAAGGSRLVRRVRGSGAGGSIQKRFRSGPFYCASCADLLPD